MILSKNIQFFCTSLPLAYAKNWKENKPPLSQFSLLLLFFFQRQGLVGLECLSDLKLTQIHMLLPPMC